MKASERFLLTQEAWETLRDADLRQEYDCRLDLQSRNVVVSDEVRARVARRPPFTPVQVVHKPFASCVQIYLFLLRIYHGAFVLAHLPSTFL